MKKAQMDLSRKTVYYIIALFVLAFMVIYMNNIIKSGNQKDVSLLGNASGNLLIAELAASPNCFAYMDDDLNRVYPGMIDMDRFNEIPLNCAKYYPGRFSLLLKGKNLGGQSLEAGKISSIPVILQDGSFAEMVVQNA